MDLKLYLSFVLTITLTSAYHDSTDDDYYDYTDDDIQGTQPPFPPYQPTKKPPTLARYEVTERVDDVPNPNPFSAPAISNFTINKPLNVVPLNATGTIRQDQTIANVNRQNPKFRKDFTNIPFDNEEDITRTTNNNENPPNTSEFDSEDDDEDYEDSHEEFHHVPNIIPTIKAYLYGLEKGIINGLNGIVGKDVFKPNKVNEPVKVAPVSFLNKLRYRKGHSHDNTHSHFDYEFDDC